MMLPTIRTRNFRGKVASEIIKNIIKISLQNRTGTEVTCPRYVLVRYLSEWLTRFVFINGWYFAVSLKEEDVIITRGTFTTTTKLHIKQVF